MDYMRLLQAVAESESSGPFFANILVTFIPLALIVVVIGFLVFRARRRKHDEIIRKILEDDNKND